MCNKPLPSNGTWLMQWEFVGSRVTPFGALRLLTGYPWPLRYFKAKAI